jgi:hypothetical protein
MVFGITLCRCSVGDLGRLLCSDHLAKRTARMRMERTTPARLGKRRRHIVACDDAQGASFIEIEVAEFRLAKSRGIRQHGLEHRFQLARRTADDTEDLRGRSLLLQRLGESLPGLSEFAGPDFELPFQLGGQ